MIATLLISVGALIVAIVTAALIPAPNGRTERRD